MPEPPQRRGYPKRYLRSLLGSLLRLLPWSCLLRPCPPLTRPSQRGPQVVVLVLQPAEPFYLLRGCQVWLRLLRQPHEVEGMLSLQRLGLCRLLELLSGIFVYRLQHAEARLWRMRIADCGYGVPSGGRNRLVGLFHVP